MLDEPLDIRWIQSRLQGKSGERGEKLRQSVGGQEPFYRSVFHGLQTGQCDGVMGMLD